MAFEWIFQADSESVVRFQIGPWEMPQMATFSDRKWPFDPLRGCYIFFYFFPKITLKTMHNEVCHESLRQTVIKQKNPEF